MIENKFTGIFRRGFSKGALVVWELLIIIVPVYFVMAFLKHTPLIPAIANACAPYMKFLGLRGEAALPLFIGFFVSIYAAVGAIAPLGLTGKEVTIMGMMITTAHVLIIETAILKKMGVGAWRIMFLRLFVAIGMGFIMNFLIR
ncbi:MAG: nucleoside recognition protein [Candidatus Omnitrophica bacterium]|nr:nucleoside recognition protein [Candidatus Omnitrophota bacterium]